MEICEEMKKLRSILDEKKIEWIDKSEEWESNFRPFGKAHIKRRKYYIHRTHFDISGTHISVINGFGTYGGYSDMFTENEGGLEIMIGECGEVIGWLSADEVIETLEKTFGKLGGISDIKC